jgi:membrane protease YdiL (CAAX protease family)
LFLLSLLAWLLVKVSGSPVGQLASAPFWVANVIAALIFGLGHLPATRALAPLTPLLVVRAVLLNGGPGILFGYLFWKRGLESAMLAHFTTDLLIHVATAV